MSDTYLNFAELSSHEKEGEDFRIELEDRGSPVAVVGIHGNQIEPGTEVVVRALAGTDLSYYLFLGNKHVQHITSTHFDEPRCLDLISSGEKVITIHGKAGSGQFVMLGGLDTELTQAVSGRLIESGFMVLPPSTNVAGKDPLNICNRGSSGKGLQIELSKELREAFNQDNALLIRFVGVIRGCL
jgi:phage replication-related protein YjqB (UPF0714/DUF867 family)